MSVTFTLGQFEEDRELGTVLFCGPDHHHSRPESCCEDAELFHGQCDHAEADEAACGCRALDVNLSNANAVAVLERLGIETDPACPAGETSGDDMLGRATVGNLGRDDDGDPSVEDGGPGTGRALVVDCGHGAGYFTRTLERLAVLAAEAQRTGKLVVWC